MSKKNKKKLTHPLPTTPSLFAKTVISAAVAGLLAPLSAAAADGAITCKLRRVALLVGALTLLATGAEAVVTAAQKCEAAIEVAAGKYAQCRLIAESKFTKKSDAAALSTALMKCEDKLAMSYGKAFTSYGGSCPTVEPASSFEAYLTQCADETEAAAAGGDFPACGDAAVNVAGEQCDGGDLGGETCTSLGFLGGTLACDGSCDFDTSGCAMGGGGILPATGQTTCWNSAGAVISCSGTGHDGDLQAGATLAYTDNGDGTITDDNTDLMWEKLDDNDTGGIHDKDNTYSWDDAFAVKVATLNSGSFAGQSDWRVPNRKELESIVNLQNAFPNLPVSSAFNTGCVPGCTATGTPCSCTVGLYYWSSSTNAYIPSTAWIVYFFDGSAAPTGKPNPNSVRAVRGGS